MAPHVLDVLIFGDQSTENFEVLQSISSSSHMSKLVRDYIDRVGSALQEQVRKLSGLDRERIPEFSCLLEMFGKSGLWSTVDPVLRGTLTCISQFVAFFRYYETRPEQARDISRGVVIGLCTGLLPAAAITSNACLIDLVPLAVEIVCIAFRIALYARSIGESIEQNASSKSWSNVLQGELPPELLAKFHDTMRIPLSHSAYLSAVTPHTVTLSGPPSTLKKFAEFTTSLGSGLSILPIPIFAPYHAVHLNQKADINSIIGTSDPSTAAILESYRPCASLLSAATGKPYTAKDMASLLKEIVFEILNQSVRWDIIVANPELLSYQQYEITTIGSTGLGKSLAAALQAKGRPRVSLNCVTEALMTGSQNVSSREMSRNRTIAIVGMAGRFPGAKNHEELWELLTQGCDLHKEIPKERFDINTHVDPSGKKKNTSYTPYGCFIDQPGAFDAQFFNMSYREAAVTDPAQRLALTTAYEALEMSGFVPNRTPSTMLDRIGTFFGQTLDGYREFNAAQNIDIHYVTGGLRPFGPGRINYHFGFTGPSFSIDTACSSSLAAVQIACTSLLNYDCDTAVAGGMNLVIGSDMYDGLSRAQFLSKSGPCMTFDDAADGYCRADAIGSVVLKRLEDAEKDNDIVLGVILSSATNHSALAASITQPHGPTQELLYNKILDQAGVLPNHINYIEMHGTGTQIGDYTEVLSVSNVFAKPKGRSPENPLFIGSVKANIGHGEAAAGVTSLIKSLLMLHKGIIPQHVGIKGRINQKFPNFKERNIKIAFQNELYVSKNGEKRRILVNNFGAAGGNTGLLLEEAPIRPIAEVADRRGTQIVVLSAKSRSSLNMNKRNLLDYLTKTPKVSMSDLSYTTTCRRTHYRLRFASATSSLEELKAVLSESEHIADISIPHVAFVFTGQGAIYSGVGKDFFRDSAQFRSEIIQFDNLAQSDGLPSFLPIFDATIDIKSFSLCQKQVGQVCIQMALYHLWKSWGITPHIVIGHSLGEYAALYASGVISASDTIFLVGRRAQLLDQYLIPGTHAMLAVKGSVGDVRPLALTTNTDIACINSTHDIVLGGSVEEVRAAGEQLTMKGLHFTTLDLPYAFHSTQMNPILGPFEELAKAVQFNTPRIPILSTLLSRTAKEEGAINASYFSRHLRETVDFVKALVSGKESLMSNNCQLVEIGPHPLCSAMIKTTLGINTLPTLRRTENSWKTVAKSLGVLYTKGVDVSWAEYHRDFTASHQLLILPSYEFDQKNHWLEHKNDCALRGADAAPSAVELQAARKSGPATSSVQRLIHEDIQNDKVSAEFESDLSELAIRNVISGHVINGVGLCPLSVYADMAFTVTKYLNERLSKDFDKCSMDISDMEIVAPIIIELSDRQSQYLRLSAQLFRGQVSIQWSTISSSGTSATIHARCAVAIRDTVTSFQSWSRRNHFVKCCIERLERRHEVERLHQKTVYRLFGAVVSYTKEFHGIDEVLLDGRAFEAVAQVSFKVDETAGNFFCSPYWIDSLAQLSGFVLNNGDSVDSNKVVYICNGWESMQIACQLSAKKSYNVYVKMHPSEGTSYNGDMYILDKGDIIAVITGVRFQSVTTPLLRLLLTPKSGALHQPSRESSSHVSRQKIFSPLITPVSSCSENADHFKIFNSSRKQDCATYVDSGGHPTAFSTQQETLIPSYADQQGVTPNPTNSSTTSENVVALVFRVISEEMGMDIDSSSKAAFSELGVDSLMSLAILGRLRESYGLDLPSTVFRNYPTVVELFESLGTDSSEVSQEKASLPGRKSFIAGQSEEELNLAEQTQSNKFDLSSTSHPPTVLLSDRQATSVLLQGNLATAVSKLFLFPGGFGTAETFASLPKLSDKTVVYGLNSAFVKHPEEFLVTIEEMASLYIVEIKRRQPRGPYNLLGYSVGGTIAYEATRQLVLAGEIVERLYFVDAPCPLVIPPLPIALIKFLDSIDRFSGKEQHLSKSNSTAKPMGSLHVIQTLKSLHVYYPKALPAGLSIPKTTSFIALQGVNNQNSIQRPEVSPEDEITLKWLLEDRVDVTNNGWQNLISESEFSISLVNGNHFSIVTEPYIAEWANELRLYF